jgi:hypothetical protein
LVTNWNDAFAASAKDPKLSGCMTRGELKNAT